MLDASEKSQFTTNNGCLRLLGLFISKDPSWKRLKLKPYILLLNSYGDYVAVLEERVEIGKHWFRTGNLLY